MRLPALRVIALVVACGAGLVAPAAGSISAAAAAPGITLSPKTGPPTSQVMVSGTGFGAFEAVDIYFDTTDEALASTGADGSFSGITISVPGSAVPGTHFITGVGRHSGLSAQAPFKVNANWLQFRFANKHRGVNPYENVLSPANTRGKALDPIGRARTTGDPQPTGPRVIPSAWWRGVG